MTDNHRPTPAAASDVTSDALPGPRSTAAVPAGSRLVNTTLWTLVGIGAGLNLLTTLAGAHLLVSAAIGLATVACICQLVVHHLRRRA